MSALRLRDVVRRHGPAYLARYGDKVLPSHRAAIQAICDCRTPKLGGHISLCAACGTEHEHYHSCRNRACPQCGGDAAERWLARQRELLLPVPYFHVVFTLPEELRRLVRTHQKALLGALFAASFQSLSTLCADPAHLGAAQIGALAVLHTWTRALDWHPHIHMLVPGGGLAADGRTWVEVPAHLKQPDGPASSARRLPFLVPVEALSVVFAACFARLARAAVPGIQLPQNIFKKRWVTFAKPVVQGPDKVLEYLGRYVHRTAIGDKAIVATDDASVTFQYRRTDDHQRRCMRLPADEFLRRFLQHVPPKGFHRVRSFGLLHPTRRTTLRRLQLLLVRAHAPAAPPTPPTPSPTPTPATSPTPKRRCTKCHGPLQIVRRLSRDECLARLAAEAADAHSVPQKGSSP